MQRILFILFLLPTVEVAFCQTYPIVQRANSSFTVQDARFSAQYNLFTPKYADTTAANVQIGIDSLGAVIYNYASQSLWVRSWVSGAKRWVEIGSGGGGSGTVTEVTGVTANGFSFSIANPTTTPAITLSTNQTGLLNGNGTSVTGTLLSADFEITSNVLYNSNWVNVVDYGADPTGVSNSATAFADAIATGRNVFVPVGTFLITGTAGATPLLTLNEGQTMLGMGYSSVITTTSNARILKGNYSSQIRDLRFTGTGSKSSALEYQAGIYLAGAGAVGVLIDNCTFENLGGTTLLNGGGIICELIISGATEGVRVNNVRINNCGYGITLDARAEYFTCVNVKIDSCNLGFYNGGGNNILSSSTIQNCNTGYSLIGGTNDAHCVTLGTTINHNTTNLFINNVANGYVFDGVMFYSGNISISNSDEIRFSSCDFSTGTITLTNNTNLIRTNSRWLSMTTSVVSGEAFTVVWDNRVNGNPIVAIDQQSADTIRWRGPLYHLGITPASASAGDSVWVKDASTGQWKLRAQSDISGGGGANVALSNLSGVAINASLIGDADNTYDLGSAANGWKDVFLRTIQIDGSSSGTISIQAAAAAGTYTLTMPTDDGTSGQFLQTNGSGVLTWATAAGSGDVIKVGTPVNNQLGVWTGDGTIEGDANLTFASSTLNIGVAGASTGIFTQSGVTSGTITFQPASAAGTYTLTWPTTDGGSGEFLQTDGTGVLTWASASGSGTVNSGTQYRIAYYATAGTAVSEAGAITASRALISDANGVPTHSAVTGTELGYVGGVTSAIQTQIDAKQVKSIGIIQAAAYTLTSTTSLQKLFDVGTTGAITVEANSTYEFECLFNLTNMSATSGNCGFDIIGAGTATATSAIWSVVGRDGTSLVTPTNSTGSFSSNTAETGNIVAAATSVNMYAYIKGTIRINGGGTIIPSVNLTTAATPDVSVNSYFKLTKLGDGSVTSF